MSGRAYHRYTETERQWLTRHLDDYGNYHNLTIAFNRAFGENVSSEAIAKQCRWLGLQKNWWASAPERGATGVDLGVERIRKGKNGKPYIWVKINDDLHKRGEDKGSYNKFWRAKHHVVWEQHHGKIPKWGVIVFLDGNTLNCDIENLYLTTNQINGIMSKNGWYDKNRDISLAALKWCELQVTLRELGGK